MTMLLSFQSIAQLSLSKFNINPSGNADVCNLIRFNNSIYFYANDGTNGMELWRYDGSNVAMATDIVPGSGSCLPQAGEDYYLSRLMCVVNNKLYLAAIKTGQGTELFVYDGANTASIVKDIRPGSASSNPDHLIEMNGVLYFSACVQTNLRDLWSYDPTTDVLTKLTAGDFYDIEDIMPMNGKVYFAGDKQGFGKELFVYDPFTAVVTMVADMEPGINGSDPRNLTVFQNKLYFNANTATDGKELYQYDGINIPGIAFTLYPGSKSTFQEGIGINAILPYQNKVVFSAWGPPGNTPYAYDPVTQQANPLVSTSLISITNFFTYAGNLYFGEWQGGPAPVESYRFSAKTQQMEKLTNTHPAFTNIYYVTYTQNINDELLITATEKIGYPIELDLYKLIDSSVSVKEVQPGNIIGVAPVPTGGDVTFTLRKPVTSSLKIDITNISGKTIGSYSLAKGNVALTISIAQLPAGVYTYTVKENELLKDFGKLVKQ